MEPNASQEERQEAARALCERLGRDVAKPGCADLGPSPAVAAAGASFLVELVRWEHAPGPATNDRMLRAYIGVLESWQEAVRQSGVKEQSKR